MRRRTPKRVRSKVLVEAGGFSSATRSYREPPISRNSLPHGGIFGAARSLQLQRVPQTLAVELESRHKEGRGARQTKDRQAPPGEQGHGNAGGEHHHGMDVELSREDARLGGEDGSG